MVAVLGGQQGRGRAFGGYGAAKGLGYVAGPVVGGALVMVGGYTLLFAVMSILAVAVAASVTLVAAPAKPTTLKSRQTVVGLVRRLGTGEFVRPVAALAGATAALSAAVGFPPVVGARHHLGPLVTGGAVSVLAIFAALVQPRAGRGLDSGRLAATDGMFFGLAACTLGMVLAVVLPAAAGLMFAAVLVGCGVGVVTPLGFAELARNAPQGQATTMMGAAEVGRELGDAGGPLVVGAIGVFSLAAGFVGLSVVLALAAGGLRRQNTPFDGHRAWAIDPNSTLPCERTC